MSSTLFRVHCHNTDKVKQLKVNRSNGQQNHGTSVKFPGCLTISSLLCIAKSNMAATMLVCFILLFYMSLKQQNLLTIQSKWSEFFKSTSCILGRIKILTMHVLDSVWVKMHDFCINVIPVVILPDLNPTMISKLLNFTTIQKCLNMYDSEV